ncbi:unnamed protein product, partial [Laminaria digitata]
DVAYRFEDLAVDGAEITISLISADGGAEEVYRYQASDKGVYRPVDESEIVQGRRRYELEISIPGHSEQLTANTWVPGDFFIQAMESDTLIYQDEEALLLSVSQSPYPGRPAIYMNKLEALDTTFALTPFYQGLYEEDEVTKQELIDNSSGITNEANFEFVSDEMLGVIVPWVAVAFYGPNDIVIDAIDDNIFDFLRSQEENGVRPLGERENVIDHISGGRGIFGSLARARTHIFVAP